MPTYKTTVEIEIEVEYDYEPAEPMTRHYPGCEARANINEIKAKCLEYGTPEWWQLAETLEEDILARIEQDEADRYADQADYHYERIRDESIMGLMDKMMDLADNVEKGAA